MAPSAQAADGSWNVDSAGLWTSATNWLGNTIPGNNTGTSNPDIATFGLTLTADHVVTVDSNRNIKDITFSNTSTYKYTLSGASLLLTSGGVIQTTSANGNHTDTISSALAIQDNGGTASFTAGAASATSILSIGAITGVSTTGNTTTLTINGTNTGANAITGIIGDGIGGGKLAITKNDAGNWTLSGVNTYRGETIVNNGILKINNSSALGTTDGGTTVNAGAELELSGNNLTVNEPLTLHGGELCGSSTYTHTYGGAITLTANSAIDSDTGSLTVISVISESGGASSLTKVGDGTVTLSGENTYSGGTTLSTGRLNIGNAKALGTGTFTIDGGSIGGSTSGTITNANNNAQSWNGDFSYVGSYRLDLGNGAVTLGGNRTVTCSLAFGPLAVSGVIDDGVNTFSLTKDGNGKLALAGANTYGGGTLLKAGTLSINNASALGTGALTITGGTLDNDTSGTIINTNNNAQYWNGDFSFYGNKSLDLGTGAVTLGNNRTVTTTFNVLTVSGIIDDGTNTFSLTKNGDATLALAGANTYDGGTILNAGILGINHSQALSTGTLTINGGTIDNSSAATVINSNNNRQNWNADFFFHGSKDLNIGTGAVTLSKSLTLTTNYNTLTVGGVIDDGSYTYGLTKSGAATLALTGANTYDGATLVNQGKLQISNPSSLGSSAAGTTVNAAGELELIGNGLTVNEALTLNGGEVCNLANTNTYGGTITLTANSGIDADTGTLNITSAIGETSGAYGLTKLGGGVTDLSGTNTYSGGTIVSAGTLTGTGSSPLGATTGTLAVNNNNTGGGKAVILNLSPTAPTTTGSLSGTIATPSSGTNSATIHNRSQPFTVNQTSAGTYAGVIADSGGFTLGSLSTNTLTLSGTNTYTGATTVSAGKLTIASTGTINSTNAVSIGAGEFNYNSSTALSKTVTFSSTGGTLSGTGTISNAVTVATGNTYTPGDVGAAGTQHFSNNLTLGSSSIFAWDLTTASTTAGFDKVTGAANMKFNGSAGIFRVISNMDFSAGTFWDTQKQWTDIFTGFQTLTGWTPDTAVAVYNSSGTERNVAPYGSFSMSGTTLTWAAVPEPTSTLAGFLLGAGLLRRRRS
jgi:autotransporter-associated beta strand protein